MQTEFDKLIADWKRQKKDRKAHSETIRRRICERGKHLFVGYGIEKLDWEKERAVAVKLPETASMLRNQISTFLEKLSTLDP